MTTATVQLADSQHPWLGLASYTEGDREFFTAIAEHRMPNASVAQVLPCYRILAELETQLRAQG